MLLLFPVALLVVVMRRLCSNMYFLLCTLVFTAKLLVCYFIRCVQCLTFCIAFIQP